MLRRIVVAFLLIWLAVSLVFFAVRLAPGEPSDFLLPPSAAPEQVAALRSELGLDRPLAIQYVDWIARVLRGDLGDSFAHGVPVSTVLSHALPVSLLLGVTSLFLTFLIGIGLAIVQVVFRERWVDRLLTAASVALYAAPSYWLALGLVAFFTYGVSALGLPSWSRLPAFGLASPASAGRGWGAVADVARHLVLPVTVLTVIGAAGIARYARTALVEIARSDWVRTARAKGLPRRFVLGRHMLANALPPLVVLLMLSLPGVVAGSVFVESVFVLPGMGRAMLQAIAARDYPVVMGATLLYAAIVIVANAAADVLLRVVDPRRR